MRRNVATANVQIFWGESCGCSTKVTAKKWIVEKCSDL